MPAREVSDRLADAVYDLDVLAGILGYLVDWARSGGPNPPCADDDLGTWEANIDQFQRDTAIEFSVALSAIRRCVHDCRTGVQGLFSAISAGASDPRHATAHERLWVAIELLEALLRDDDIVDQIWECEDVWHEVWPDSVRLCADAAAIANRAIPPGTLNELVVALAEESAHLAGAAVVIEPTITPIEKRVAAVPREAAPSDQRMSDAVAAPEEMLREEKRSRRTKRLPIRTPRSVFGEWRFFDDRVEHRGLRLELRRGLTFVLEWFARAGDDGLTLVAFRKHLENANYEAEDDKNLSSLVRELETELECEQGWAGYVLEGSWHGGRPRRLVLPSPKA